MHNVQKILNKFFFIKVLPESTPNSSNDLDTSTMYAMLRNTSNISRPTRGWGQLPGKNDIKTADDIERLRYYRNKICHENSSKLTTADFNNFVLDFVSVRCILLKNGYTYSTI